MLVYQIAQKISINHIFQYVSYIILTIHTLCWLFTVGGYIDCNSISLNINNIIFPVFNSSGDKIHFRFLKYHYQLGNYSEYEWPINIFYFLIVRAYAYHFSGYAMVTFLFAMGYPATAGIFLNL